MSNRVATKRLTTMELELRMTQESRFRVEAERLLSSHTGLAGKIRRAVFCSPDQVAEGLEETLKFLSLAAESQDSCTPSRRVDLVWHELILFTRLYEAYCHREFGKFIHHEPAADSSQSYRQLYLSMLAAYRERFGESPTAWWDQSGAGTSDCGTCDAVT